MMFTTFKQRRSLTGLDRMALFIFLAIVRDIRRKERLTYKQVFQIMAQQQARNV